VDGTGLEIVGAADLRSALRALLSLDGDGERPERA